MNEYSEILKNSLLNIWEGFLNFLPSLLIAVIIFIFGLIIGAALQKLVEKTVRFLWVNQLLKKLKITDIFEKASIKLDVAKALGIIANWFVVFAFLVASTDIIGLSQVSSFLRSVVVYLPNVFVAAIIIAVGLLIANWVYQIVYKGIQASKFTSPGFGAGITKWSIIVFSILAALVQLKVTPVLLQTLFTGFVAMIALAGGLAFGLGGKEQANKLLQGFQRDVTSKKNGDEERQ
ncbi:MAG: hypothetical protein V1838_04350 [Patescibacteria group bacterium]